MEIGTEGEETNIAGNSASQGKILTPQGEAHHDELLPVVAPMILDAPAEEKVESPAKNATIQDNTPLAQSSEKPIEIEKTPIQRAIEKLNTGNVIATASTFSKEVVVKTETPSIPAEMESPIDGITLIPTSEESMEGYGVEKPKPMTEVKPRISEVQAGIESPATDDGLPRIRTYATDMSEEIRKRGSTLTSIVGAEKKRNAEAGIYTGEKPIEQNKSRVLFFVGGAVLLVILGALSIGVALMLQKPGGTTPTRTALISTNRSEKIEEVADMPLAKLLAGVRASATLNLGEVEAFSITDGGVPLTAEQVLTALGAPNELARNASDIMVGVHSFEYNQPFILIRVSEYDRAFAAMLVWESTMSAGLDDFFKPTNVTSSGITSIAPLLTFTDHVSQNIDIRESQPEWPVVYAFLGRDLLLITTNESTLHEIVTRVSAQKSQ